MADNRGMGGHQSHKMIKDEWITPKTIHDAFETYARSQHVPTIFDLDPCAAINQPWNFAIHQYTIEHDGLNQPWSGNVWLNPPYGKQTAAWLSRLVQHGQGIALIFARTETSDWFDFVWSKATAVLFLRGRLHFHHVDGKRAKHNSGAPSALIAYGGYNARLLQRIDLDGQFIRLIGLDGEPFNA